MNLFADLLAATQPGRPPNGTVTQSGPRIQKSRRGVEVKSAREIAVMRQASRIVATVLREMMAMAAPDEPMQMFNTDYDWGSISMRSVRIGAVA